MLTCPASVSAAAPVRSDQTAETTPEGTEALEDKGEMEINRTDMITANKNLRKVATTFPIRHVYCVPK
jgi:hypothetical protein